MAAASDAQSEDSYFGDEESNATQSPTKYIFSTIKTESGAKHTIYEPLPEYVAAQYEDIERYRPGGFHPIHIGDYLDASQRFRVLHKLGFGSSSTVWLCFDHHVQRFRAVKVVAADESAFRCHDNAEIEALVKKAREEDRRHTIVTVAEKFWIEGPNGHHLCLVMPVLGPNLLDGFEGAGLDTPEYLTDLCYDLGATVACLHHNNIVHGDIRPAKIMMVLADQWMWQIPRRKLYETYLQKPTPLKLKLLMKTHARHGPKYVMPRANLTLLERHFRTGKVALTDFSRACQSTTLLNSTTLHHSGYSAPEIRLRDTTHGIASDVWSLAACLHLLRTGKELVPQMSSDAAHIVWLSWNFGPLANVSVDKLREILMRSSTTLVDTDSRGEEEVHIWLESLEWPASRHRRAESKRTFKRAIPGAVNFSAKTSSRMRNIRGRINDPGSANNNNINDDTTNESSDTVERAPPSRKNSMAAMNNNSTTSIEPASAYSEGKSTLSNASSTPPESPTSTGTPLSSQRSPRRKPRPPPRFIDVFLPRDCTGWLLLQAEHADRTGFASLLHESLGCAETWHEIPGDARSRYTPMSSPSSLSSSSRSENTRPEPKRRVSSSTITASGNDDHADGEIDHVNRIDIRSRASSRKTLKRTSEPPRDLRRSPRTKRQASDQHLLLSGSNYKRTRREEVPIVEAAIDTRDEASCKNESDGMIKYVYRMRSEEVEVFADLLFKTLQPESRRRISAEQMLRHAWFGHRRWPERKAPGWAFSSSAVET